MTWLCRFVAGSLRFSLSHFQQSLILGLFEQIQFITSAELVRNRNIVSHGYEIESLYAVNVSGGFIQAYFNIVN